MPLSAFVFWLFYIGGALTSLIYPLAGLLLYIIVTHVNPESQWWGESVRAVNLRTSFVLMIAIAIGVLLRRPSFKGCGKQFTLPVILALAFAAYAMASLTWGVGASDSGYGRVEKLIKLLIEVMLLIRLIRTPAQHHLFVWAWLLGVLYIGVQAWRGLGLRYHGRLTLGLGGSDFSDSSDLAAHLVATLPLIGAMFFMARSWLARGVVFAIAAFTVNTIVLTRTRNALVGIFAMAFVALFWLPKNYRKRGIVALVLGGAVAFQLTDSGFWERAETIFNRQQDQSVEFRLAYWRAAIQMAQEYPLGIGVANFQSHVREYIPDLEMDRSAHSSFFQVLAELGWPGFALFCFLVIVTLKRLSDARSIAQHANLEFDIDVWAWRARYNLAWHTMALQTGLVGYVACSVFTTRTWASDFWMLLGLSAALQNVTVYAFEHYAVEKRAPGTRVETAPPKQDAGEGFGRPGLPGQPHATPEY